MNLTRITNRYFNNHPVCNSLSKRFNTQLISTRFKSFNISNLSKSQSKSESKYHLNKAMTGSFNSITLESTLEDVTETYSLPPKEIIDLVDIPPNPSLSISPDKTKILQLMRPSIFPPISELARPELKLAGLTIDGAAFSRSRNGYYTDMAFVEFGKIVPATEKETKKVTGIPDGMWINSVSYSPKGTKIAFTIRSPGGPGDPPREASELWCADVDTAIARPILKDSRCLINSIFQEYIWIDENEIIAFCLPDNLDKAPEKPIAPKGPIIQDNSQGKQSQNRTYQDLLKDTYDCDLFEYYCTSQLVSIDLEQGIIKHKSTPRIYTEISNSPDTQYLLVSWMEKPFSYQVPCGRFPKTVQLWKKNLDFIKEIEKLPLADDIPLAFDSCRKGKRNVRWRPDLDSEIVWVEAQDEGDPDIKVSPRDIVYALNVNSDINNNSDDVRKIAETDLRYSGIIYCDGDLALLSESWYNTRKTITKIIAPDNPAKEPVVLFDRSYEDLYNDPGRPMTRYTSKHTRILLKINNERKILLNGIGASEKGNIPFLDILDLETREKKRIWESKPPQFEYVSSLIFAHNDDVITEDNLKVLVSKETTSEVPQYYHEKLSINKEMNESKIMTQFPHPYPHMKDVNKIIVKYKREDGVDLQGTLYLPVNYDKEKDGPLPCLMWIYPEEYKSKDAAGQMKQSPHEFISIGRDPPKLWLVQGYAIFDNPSLPIVAEGEEEEPNDTYIEQLTSSAKAAVEELIKRGYVIKDKIAVGGHSYGAFTSANLLAHCPDLFSCAIAQSGAYNRTLTPFSFQSEQRPLWKAPETYLKMSPFMYADKIKKPILIIHGNDDSNPGTMKFQSERFYSALKGNGVITRLVLLPFEKHGYRAKESIMHALFEVDQWLKRYCNGTTMSNSSE